VPAIQGIVPLPKARMFSTNMEIEVFSTKIIMPGGTFSDSKVNTGDEH
jgi:hypothetical protein